MRRQGLYYYLASQQLGSPDMTGSESPAPFLDADPPPWAVRALATILLAALRCRRRRVVRRAGAGDGLGYVHAPASARHRSGAHAARRHRREGQCRGRADRAAGTVLFVIASEPVGDRMAERQTVDARLSGGRTRVDNERQRYENQRRADTQEQGRLQQHLANLETQLDAEAASAHADAGDRGATAEELRGGRRELDGRVAPEARSRQAGVETRTDYATTPPTPATRWSA
jgi:hypothetical protein